MPDRTLLIPGTQASNLFDANGVQVWNAVRVGVGLTRDELGGRPASELRPVLSMEHRPGQWAPVRTSLSQDTELHAPSIVRTPYDSLLDVVDAEFAYDWRGDIRHNGQRLRAFMEENRPPDGGRWNLIGHSQGCHVVVAASKLMPAPDDFARLVARVILVAAPLAGTMRAAEALLFGRDDLGGPAQTALRGAIRTWPALYQMLPSWSAVLGANGAALGAGKQFTQPGGWVDVDDVDPALLADMCTRAREAHALFEGPFSYMGPGVAKLVILGRTQPTPISIRRVDDAMEVGSETFERGDNLVPYQQTIEWGGKPFSGWVLALANARDHSFLCCDEDAVSAIRKVLKRAAPKPPASPLGPIV
jgi:hypothetical protein